MQRISAAICWHVHQFQLLQRSAASVFQLALPPKGGPLLPDNIVFLFLMFHVVMQHGGIPARGAGQSAE